MAKATSKPAPKTATKPKPAELVPAIDITPESTLEALANPCLDATTSNDKGVGDAEVAETAEITPNVIQELTGGIVDETHNLLDEPVVVNPTNSDVLRVNTYNFTDYTKMLLAVGKANADISLNNGILKALWPYTLPIINHKGKQPEYSEPDSVDIDTRKVVSAYKLLDFVKAVLQAGKEGYVIVPRTIANRQPKFQVSVVKPL